MIASLKDLAPIFALGLLILAFLGLSGFFWWKFYSACVRADWPFIAFWGAWVFCSALGGHGAQTAPKAADR